MKGACREHLKDAVVDWAPPYMGAAGLQPTLHVPGWPSEDQLNISGEIPWATVRMCFREDLRGSDGEDVVWMLFPLVVVGKRHDSMDRRLVTARSKPLVPATGGAASSRRKRQATGVDDFRRRRRTSANI